MMMAELFCDVLNRSVTTGIVILAVILVRFLFGRLPKLFSYLLWFAVLLRLCCPVSIHADFGLVTDVDITQIWLPFTETMVSEKTDSYVPGEISVQENITTGTDTNTETTHIYEISDKTGKGEAFTLTFSYESAEKLAIIWLFVGGVLLIYEVIGYCRFVYRLKPSKKEKIVISSKVKVPFVTGIVRPVIYLPVGLDKVQQELIILHEKIHIKRLDYLIKPLFLFFCCVYWFNPLIWVAFYLMIQDMESSCDEAVIRSIGYDRKKEYAYTLLELSTNGTWKVGYPIAFGENNVKRRIKNVAKNKKKAAWVIGVGGFLAGGAILLLSVNRTDTLENVTVLENPSDTAESSMAEYFPEERNQSEAGQEKEQMLPAEEIVVTENENPLEDTKHEYYGSDDVLPVSDAVSAEPDKFAVLLQDGPEAYYDLEIVYRYPVEDATIVNSYGIRVHPVTGEEKAHSGVDFVAEEGTPVMAAAEGYVAETGFDAECGNYVIIQHINGELTYYACCKDILATKGAEVKRGEQIATVGKTGTSTGAHLHFAVSKNGVFLEPVLQAENLMSTE